MAQVFPRSANTAAKVTIAGGLLFFAFSIVLLDAHNRSPYVTRVDVAMEQPVPFSHRHHVSDIGIDCRYCHTSVEDSSFAGIPSSKTCMNCHAQIWKDSPMLEPVRASFRDDTSIEWVRIHDLPDYVYFNHSIHVAKGIGCSTCHGQVDQMPLMRRENTLHMTWCLQCHRSPEKFIRPREEIFNMDWPPAHHDQKEAGEKLVQEYHVEKLTSCSVCHR